MDLSKGIMPEPDDLQTLLETDAHIFVYSGSDQQYRLREKLDLEWDNVPLSNSRLVEDVDGELDITQRILLVYVNGFFTDESDFIYYVKGGTNITRFLKGTFSGKPYDAPCFATPCYAFDGRDLFDTAGLSRVQRDEVPKTETKGLRWKYLYESAVKAWGKLEWDQDKHERIQREDDEWLQEEAMNDAVTESEVATSDEEIEVPASEPTTPSTAQTSPGSGEQDSRSDDGKVDTVEDEMSEDSNVPLEKLDLSDTNDEDD